MWKWRLGGATKTLFVVIDVVCASKTGASGALVPGNEFAKKAGW